MISAKFRSRLIGLSMFVMFGGPIFSAIAMFIAIGTGNPASIARAISAMVELTILAFSGGGMLRLLVSIDERLEANR